MASLRKAVVDGITYLLVNKTSRQLVATEDPDCCCPGILCSGCDPGTLTLNFVLSGAISATGVLTIPPDIGDCTWMYTNPDVDVESDCNVTKVGIQISCCNDVLCIGLSIIEPGADCATEIGICEPIDDFICDPFSAVHLNWLNDLIEEGCGAGCDGLPITLTITEP